MKNESKNGSGNSELPVVDCRNCGVCCFHMGYPPFIRPTNEKEGESWWYKLPENLRQELDEYISSYEPKNYTADVASFDGPCFWLDMETRLCKHHQHRPNVCRGFETGSKRCLEWRNYYAEEIKSNDIATD